MISGRARHRLVAPLIVVAVIVSGCEGTRSSASPNPSRSSAPPLSRDVLTYKGDAARRGVMPGPGFTVDPVELWRADAEGFIAPPLVVDGLAIAIDGGVVVRAFDLATGVQRWTIELPGVTRSAPTVAEGTLYVVTDDGVLRTYALVDHRPGWIVEGVATTSTVAIEGGLLIVGRLGGGALGLDATTGEERWATTGGPVARTAIVAGRPYVTGDDSGLVSTISAGGDAIQFDTHAGRVLTPSARSADGAIVIADGVAGGRDELIALDSALVKRWSHSIPEGDLEGHAVTPERIVLSISRPNVIVSLDSAAEGEQWRAPIEDAGRLSVPAVADGVVYVFAEGLGVVALDAASGEVAWVFPIDGWHPFGVVATDGVVLAVTEATSRDRGLFALVAEGDARLAALPSTTILPSPSPVDLPFAVETIEALEPGSLILSVAKAPDGTLYLGDMAGHRVIVRAPDGTTTAWGERGSDPGQFDFAEVTRNDTSVGLAVSADGSLIAVGDAGNRRVQIFDADGNVAGDPIGRLGRGPGQFINSCCVAFDGSSRLWVSDPGRHDVQAFDAATGSHLLTFGEEGHGDGQLSRPGAPFVIDATDEVYIPDFGNRRVAVFSTTGDWLRNNGSRPGDGLVLDEVNAVVVDRTGRMFVLDTTGTIHVLDGNGRPIAALDVSASSLGASDLAGFTLDDAGRITIVDLGENRLATLQLDSTLWPR